MSAAKDEVSAQTVDPQTQTPSESLPKDASVAVVQNPPSDESENEVPADVIDEKTKGFFAYFKTKEFYIALALGQLLAIANTSTGTFTTLLIQENWAIPTFQVLLNYTLLTCIFTPYTIYRYGFKDWCRLVWRDGWKYIILAFCDVQGNFFLVLAYQYTTILSAQLINFWAIVVVVVLSFLFLKVRYHVSQIIGILVCIGGMGVLIASDHINGINGGNISRNHQIKGDMFALLGATFYGFTNTAEEYFVSTRPVYEVLGQLSLYGMIIDGVQSAIFERQNYVTAHWNANVAGYLVGFTLVLTLFYCLAPLLFRLSSAAFFNISLLTMNFWNVCIGIQVFHYTIHRLYPVAFCLIIVGHLVYYLGHKALAEARKPWLGKNQERGIAGLFTAKKKIEHVTASSETHNESTTNSASAV